MINWFVFIAGKTLSSACKVCYLGGGLLSAYSTFGIYRPFRSHISSERKQKQNPSYIITAALHITFMSPIGSEVGELNCNYAIPSIIKLWARDVARQKIRLRVGLHFSGAHYSSFAFNGLCQQFNIATTGTLHRALLINAYAMIDAYMVC